MSLHMRLIKPFTASVASGWAGSLILVLFSAGLFSINLTYKLIPVILVFNSAMAGFMLVDKNENLFKTPMVMAVSAGGVTALAVVLALIAIGFAYLGWLVIGPADGLLFVCLGPVAGWLGGRLALKAKALR